ncbi:metallophosphoesterase family protein [Bacteroides propionicifaciens]|uniref:metallophosphoesterase family protein n=1 Tax=Bacteroides propionicifaciens TaxID=392838 RepID=UPI000379FAFA|nr:metallophosphoesterase [Bacteroides propionicifaciens]
MMTKLLKMFTVLCLSAFVLSGCNDDDNAVVKEQTDDDDNQELVGNYKIAVASDTHYFDQSLLIKNGSAFKDLLRFDRKLLLESGEILDNMFEQIIAQNPQFLMIPGDLTKDGEMISHVNFAKKLKLVEDAGVPVFVIPGNHDLNNPHAFEFDGNKRRAVAHVNPDEFKVVYKDFGYDESEQVEAGPRLSYVAEPVDGLWLISIDSNIYENNIAEKFPRTGGALDKETLDWVLRKIKEGKSKGKKMIAMMHHGIIDHFKHQAVLAKDYLVDDNMNITEAFARAGLQFVFTGHAHAQDVSMRTIQNNEIYDIQTGSSITYPCPYRTVTLTDDKFSIRSHDILLNSKTTANKELRAYAYDDVYLSIFDSIDSILEGSNNSSQLRNAIVSVVKFIRDINRPLLQPLITEIYTNLAAGDEEGVKTQNIDSSTGLKIKTMDYVKDIFNRLGLTSLYPLVDDMTYDVWPSDNNLDIPLRNN